jgi:hypothetical protein
MLLGTEVRTDTYRFLLYWEPLGPNADLNLGGRLGKWVRANERAVDKLTPAAAIKQLTEQFPSLSLVEARHSNGLLGRYTK